MKSTSHLYILIVALSLSSRAWSNTLSLSFISPVFRTSGQPISINDLVTIDASESDKQSIETRLSSLYVSDFYGSASDNGLAMTPQSNVTAENLISVIKSRAFFKDWAIKWRGQSAIKIIDQDELINLSESIQLAEEKLRNFLEKQFEKVELRRVTKNRTLRFEKPYKHRVLRSLSVSKLGRRMAVTVDFFTDHKLILSVPIWFEVSVFSRVLVARNDIERHSLHLTRKMRFKLTDVTGFIKNDIASKKDLVGRRTVKRIEKNSPIRIRDLENEPLVKRSERITVNYAKGGILIKTSGVAMEDGVLGEKVLVNTDEGAKLIQSIVTGKKRVRVES